MECLAVFKPAISPNFTSSLFSFSLSPNLQNSCRRIISIRVQRFNFKRQIHHHHQINCSSIENQHNPPQQAILKVISDISKAEGRIGRTTNLVLGGTVIDDSNYDGISLNKMLDIYPAARGFTAIGSGGDDFVQSMVVAVESVIQHPIPQGKVKQKLSSGGKYVSVNIGPVQIVSSKQVQAVYYAMKRDVRMRYFL